MTFQKLAVIGCGLMGGSFALGLKQAGMVKNISGFSASEKTRQRAQQLQVIDIACDSVAQALQGADLVLLAVPVSATRQSLEAIVPALSPNALLMDVGSTKCDVVAAARQALGERLPTLLLAKSLQVSNMQKAISTKTAAPSSHHCLKLARHRWARRKRSGKP